MIWFAYLFIGQVIVGGIVIFILIKVLDQMLFDIAVKQIEYWKPGAEEKSPSKLVIISHKNLNLKKQDRIRKASRRTFGEKVMPVFQVDRRIKGGVRLQIGERAIDCSLKDRLHRAITERRKCRRADEPPPPDRQRCAT